jgi:hypothetical protein
MPAPKLVKDYLGKRGKKGDQGLELEVEASEPLPEIDTEHWVTKLEPSLRGGERGMAKEYISKGVLQAYQVPRAIAFLSKTLEDPKLKVMKDSKRTSFHVHNNVLYLEPRQLWTNVCAYWLCENVLFSRLPGHRQGNHFCLRLSDAEGTLRSCVKDLKEEAPFSNFSDNAVRYSGQNLASITKFGSIEYRGMEGTTDGERLSEWSSELLSLTSKVPTLWDTPDQMMDEYYSQGAAHFLSRIFSSKFLEPIFKVDYRGMMEENEGTLLELVYFHDWKAWQTKIEKKLLERKEEKPPSMWYVQDTAPATPYENEGPANDIQSSTYASLGSPVQPRPSPQRRARVTTNPERGVEVRWIAG